MKVIFEKSKLLAALIPVSGISQVKNTITTVDGLLFECPPDKKYGTFDGDPMTTCRISTFDLEKGIQTTVACRTEETGMYVINTNKILQIVKVMPEGDVTIEVDERNRVRVTGGQSSFEITAQNGEDFPTMPMFKGDNIFTLPQHSLRDLLDATVFAVAQNDQRPAFNGALVRIRDGVITLVGSDGNRLAIANAVLPEGADSASAAGATGVEMVIPGKYLLELSRMLRDTEEDVTLIFGRKHIIAKIDDIYFFTRMIEHAYMQYERVLPQLYRTQCYVSAAELTGAIERASLVTEDRLGGNSKPYLKLTFAPDHIEVYSVSSGGSIEEAVPCALEGDELVIGFTCRLLLDTLRAVPSDVETLRLRLNTPLMGITIESAGVPSLNEASPDPEVFGDRALDTARDKADKVPELTTMYLVMPTRMNK